MNLRYIEVFAEAARIWRVDRPVLAAVAGIFYFLPQLAVLLFLPFPDTAGLSPEQGEATVMAWLAQNLHWLGGQLILQAYGSAVILTLLLDPAKPALGAALGTALRHLPRVLIAQALIGAAIFLGLLILFVPGFYLMGRLTLTTPIVIAERGLNPVEAVVAGFERTRGRGWWLFLPIAAVTCASFFLAGSPHQLAEDVAPMGPLAAFPLELLSAVLASGCAVAMVLIQAVLYRALGSAMPGPKQGT